MLMTLRFHLDGRELGETKTGAVPNEGQAVVLEHTLRGRRRYRVVDVEHQYTEVGSRRAEKFLAAPVVVHLRADDR
ncbi:hypothetical protein [Micromonospora arborensis]|uniref:hypothetical protein n=1 Tax=Micromonospora arborensis TaxID=2116518 RepID=UPI003720DC27